MNYYGGLLVKNMIGYDTKPLKISFIVICFISSFIFPFIFVLIFQDIFFFSRSHWFFKAPFTSYALFFGGMMAMAILLTVDEVVKSKRIDYGKKTGPWLIILSFVAASIFSVFSINNYYFFDDDGLHYNTAFELDQKDLNWDKVKIVEQVTTRKNNMEVFKEHIFITEDGREYIIPYDRDFMEKRHEIINNYEANGAKIVRRFEEPKS